MRVVVVPMYPREFRFGRKTAPDICRGWKTHFGFDNSGNSIQEGTLKTFSSLFENLSRSFSRSIRFQTGNLENFGRMESVPVRSHAKNFEHMERSPTPILNEKTV